MKKLTTPEEVDEAIADLSTEIDRVAVEVDTLLNSADNDTQKRREGVKVNRKLTILGTDLEEIRESPVKGTDPLAGKAAATKLREVVKKLLALYGVGVTPPAPTKESIIADADKVIAAVTALCHHVTVGGGNTPGCRKEGVQLNVKLTRVGKDLDTLPQDGDVQACKARLAVAILLYQNGVTRLSLTHLSQRRDRERPRP